jgi:hypothetical protein
LLLAACAGTGEAADPSQILGEDASYADAEGSAPNTQPRQAADPAQQPASEADCKRAAEHVVALGYDLEIDSESDPAVKERMRKERAEALSSETAQHYVRATSDECLAQGSTKADTACLVSAKSEADVERCVAGP